MMNLIYWLAAVTFLLVPMLWFLRMIWIDGADNLHPGKWPNLIMQVGFIALGVMAVYWLNTDHQLMGVMALAAYILFSWGAWKGILQVLKFDSIGGGGGDEPDQVERGSRMVSAAQLNARTSGGKSSGGDVSIGGVTIPRTLEAQHFLISGTTGAGKTQVINGMLRSIRKRGNRAVIADPAGGFYARFGQPGDVLINPFDKRSVAWSPFNEIRADYDCDRIAKAIIPDLAGGGDGAQWQLFAQTLLARVMLAMHKNGERSIKRLLYWMVSASQKDLEPLLSNTAAAILCQKGNDKMLNNTRATMLPYLGIFEYLPDEGDFSIRKWIQKDFGDSWMFISYRDDQMGMLRNLVATFLELALVEGLSLSESQERGLWYIMDEVDSLGKVTSLRSGLTKLRKYGGRCVLGVQTVSQLRTTYGRDEAQTLIANTSVKCILRAGDAETAKSMEQEIGEQQIKRKQENDSLSINEQGSSQSLSTSTQVLRQTSILASEIMGLSDLHGFLKLPGEEFARIEVEYVGMTDANPAFV